MINYIGLVADVMGILSFFISAITLLVSHTIFKNISRQQTEYNSERLELQLTLIALRQNIWDDDLSDISIRSKLRTELYKYRQKYWKISSLTCLWHIFRALQITRNGINSNNREKLCTSIDYLIARFSKQEETTKS